MPSTDHPVRNIDIWSLVVRLHRILVELVVSSSARVTVLLPADAERLLSYLADLERCLDWIRDQPILDYPASHRRRVGFRVPGPSVEALEDVESEVVVELVAQIGALQDELVASPSAPLPSTLLPADDRRCREYIARVRSYVQLVASADAPVDYPASSPKPAPARRPGRRRR